MMTPDQLAGITKARLTCNLTRAPEDHFATDAAYLAWVCEQAGITELPPEAADSYAAQYADRSIAALESDLAAKALADVTGEPAPEPTATPIPARVTPLQMRKALRKIGLKSTVDAFVATLDEESREEWEYALMIERNNPLLSAAAEALGMDQAQLDGLFVMAAGLT